MLLSSGTETTQNTWMDAKIGNYAVTPRNGKVVELNALWYNALNVMYDLATRFGAQDKESFKELAQKVKESFCEKFWNEEKQCLYDVVDDNGNDDKIRPR